MKSQFWYGIQFFVSAWLGVMTFKQNGYDDVMTFKWIGLFAFILIIVDKFFYD